MYFTKTSLRKELLSFTQRTKKYLQEVRTWSINEAKWKAARKYCDEKGFDFQLITEKELRI